VSLSVHNNFTIDTQETLLGWQSTSVQYWFVI